MCAGPLGHCAAVLEKIITRQFNVFYLRLRFVTLLDVAIKPKKVCYFNNNDKLIK